jgi:hypothetical protein
MLLATMAARFFHRELHSVLGDKWRGRVRFTLDLRRDLQWWALVPSQANGKDLHRQVQTSYILCNISFYGWGAVLNGRLEARGLWVLHDEHRHIT